MLDNMFFRIVGSFILLWAILRIIGKKEMGRITYYNLATAAAMGTLAGGLASDTRTNPLYYVGPLLGYFALTYLMGYASLKSITARKIFEGEPTVVISNGKVMENNLRKMRLSTDNLMKKLREKKVFNVSDVEFAVMEPEGKISILLRKENQPVTPKDMNIPVGYQQLPLDVIKDGKIIEENIKKLGITKSWLKEQIKTHNVENIKDVALAQIDTSGNLYVDSRDDYK
ncbi:YetF domain-containing protein [Thermohalobacter berrensis]|uniref:YetF C-terminal domain-containing protein n=1 Tax=Thermohalobacter berrensis TaxID=99594 RepID=A0A419SXU5_9FIRM|nr:DUF421 domain-containing protein [Thermohalobacter berrensis]RKD30054.1 hypothetical protein BET03_04945 [Thermohalobacter berrensis]